jgi:hypothetical protein
MALRATVSVEGRAKAFASFAGKSALNGIDFDKASDCLIEKALFIAVQGGVKSPGACGSSPRTGIVLRD